MKVYGYIFFMHNLYSIFLKCIFSWLFQPHPAFVDRSIKGKVLDAIPCFPLYLLHRLPRTPEPNCQTKPITAKPNAYAPMMFINTAMISL